jgi:hypothetical protein
MMAAKAELKAELMREAELAVDELLKWSEGNPQPDLTQIEEVVLNLRERLGEKMAGAVLEKQAAKQPVPGPRCPTCQREMRYKGVKANRIGSRVGELVLERGYYYCERCQAGIFPPG